MLLFIATRPFYIRYQPDMWKVTGPPPGYVRSVCVITKERANPKRRTDGVGESENVCERHRERAREQGKKDKKK